MALIWIMCGDPSRPPTVQRVRAVGNDEIKAFEGQLDHGGIVNVFPLLAPVKAGMRLRSAHPDRDARRRNRQVRCNNSLLR